MSIFLLLDWTALDDITTGNEPSLFGEYLILILSLPILILIGYLLYSDRWCKITSMAKRRTGVGKEKKSHSYKTKKRLEIKRQMLAKKATKKHR